MATQENRNILVNRIVSFIAGGLLVFAVMSFTVVSSAKKENKQLTSTLDVSRYEAGRLLADAKAQFESLDYAEAGASLENLFMNQPGSSEAAEGKKLLVQLEAAEKAANTEWNNALAEVRTKWFADRAAELREKSDNERAKLEEGLTAQIEQEWEKAKEKVRAEWEIEG
jgi:hypothetical protein